MEEKEVLIIVPGAKYLNDQNILTRWIILSFYKSTRVLRPVYTNYAKEWVDKFRKEGRKVVWLKWNRGVTPWSRKKALNLLKGEVLRYQKEGMKINIVGVSLGGDIALRLLDGLGKSVINKVILICSTNTNKKVKNKETKIFNIYSSFDLFASLMTKLLAPFRGGVKLNGDYVKNIEIENFSHDMFCSDSVVDTGEYKGKKITEIANDFLLD